MAEGGADDVILDGENGSFKNQSEEASSRVLPLVKTNFELCLYISARACMIPFIFLSRNDPVSLPFQ